MAGGKWAQKIQLGQESTAGTAVAATALWAGVGRMLDDRRQVIMPRYQEGFAVPRDVSYTPALLGGLEMASTEATFEQLDYVLSAAIKDQITGTADGSASSGYTRTYPAAGTSYTALNSIQTFTIETGDNQQAEEMEYAFVESFSLSGNAGEALMVNASWLGRQVQNVSFTGSIDPTAVEPILVSKGTLSIDPYGSIGSTSKASTLLGFTLDVTTGWQFKQTANGQLYPDFHYYNVDAWDATLTLIFEHNAAAVIEKTAWRNETGRAVRISIPGSAYGTAGSGTTFSGTKGLRLDFYGKYESFEALDERDGNSIYRAVLKPMYNTTDTAAMTILVANEVDVTP